MKCLGMTKRKRVNSFYPCVLWTPLKVCYAPKYSQPGSCSKVILGQLQVFWPIYQTLLHASCFKIHTSGAKELQGKS